MTWVQTKDRLPSTGSEVQCRLKHFSTGKIQEHRLVKVNEDDCSWRTADDRSEISYNWDVVEWWCESISPAAPTV